MELPEIHEAERLQLNPGDALVVRNTEIEIDQYQADEIARAVRNVLGKPDLPVLVFGRDWEVTVAEPPAFNPDADLIGYIEEGQQAGK